MRTIAFLIPVLLTAAWSCNDSQANEPVFGAELPASNFTVDPAKDTVLKTPGGTKISIPAASLDAGSATSVTLEVKEALNNDDMNRGGLLHGSSEANSSAGMIYINVTGGQSVTIHKPLTISIPAKNPGSEMMVYKGVAGDDALLKWTEARPLASTPSHPPTDAGKTLFESRCASCHGGKEEVAGPPLAWITSRRDRQWLYAFTRNNAILLWRGDSYSCYLFNRYKAPMPLFKDLTDADLGNLYNYIASASKSVDSGAVPDHKRSFDSCIANDANCSAAAQRVAHTDTVTAAAPTETSLAEVYSFTVDKHGWYNIAGKSGAQPVVAATFPAVSADSLHPAPEPLQACPCWCNESAYRRADSLGREKPARPARRR